MMVSREPPSSCLGILATMLTSSIVILPGNFTVWLASKEAAFLKNKYVWVNWDVDELIAKKKHIQETKDLEVFLGGVPI